VTTVVIPGFPVPLDPEGSPPSEHELRDGAIIMSGAAGTDLFVDPSGEAPQPDAGRLMGPAPEGDFTLAARVSVEFASRFDAGVLLVYADQGHWAKLCFEYSPQLVPTAVTVVTRDTSDDCNSFEVADRTLWLRVSRTGRAWAFHASTDGQWWRLLRYFALADPAKLAAEVRIGFLAQSPTGAGCRVVFDQISLRPGAPSDLRDGG
jgi:regulation of enolase protein 1 (concanavalin A-like superfamily)